MFRVPAVGVKEIRVESGITVGGRIPDGGEVVDCVGRDGENGALWEVVVADGDARAGRDDAGEAEGGGGVDAEGFGYYIVETASTVRLR